MPEKIATDAWDLEEEEKAPPTDSINTETINPEIPRELWDNLLWQATRMAIDVSETKEEVIRRVKRWNKQNNPQLDEKGLVQKVLWALSKWDTKFHNA